MRTGVAGCGRMGLPMAQALSAAGVTTTGFDIRRTNDFGALTMEFAPARFAHDLTTLFTVVRDEPQTDALLFEEQALISHAPALEYLVVCSTVSPAYVRNLRKRIPDHVALVDAPMSGAPIAAMEARLSFMIGGETDIIDELMLHFAAMGTEFHLMGALGTGMTAKVLNNLVAAASTAATRTALDWARHQGLAQDKMLEVMQTSSGQTWFGSNFEDIEFARAGFEDDNSIGLLVKDIEAALTTAPSTQPVVLPEALIETIRRLEPLVETD